LQPSPAGTEVARDIRGILRHVRGRSPLYERLLAGLAGAAERGFDGGVLARLVSTPGPANVREAVFLVLAAVHLRALEDPGAPHAAWYPTAVPDPRSADDGAPGALVLAEIVENVDELASFVATHRQQTNEVGRCAGLLPGFLEAAAYGLPLSLHELGASAGLNLRFDRYRYRYLGGPSWGPVTGPAIECRAEGEVRSSLTPPTVEVAERRGVDLAPIDPMTDAGRRLLTAFVWPDDAERVARLDAALEVAGATPAAVDAGDLSPWVGEVAPRTGTATVVFHSLVTHLLDPATEVELRARVERLLRAGTAQAPVITLELEPPPGTDLEPELNVTVGDGSGPPRRRTSLSCDWHGRWVRWW
jgi:hypothetical protein